ncbi:MAG: SLC13 family permease [Planctomycetes bacterium]|nr:SLC13 family permease [Planctomycetota bacterium]
MEPAGWFVLGIVAVAIILLVTEKVSMDVVGLGIIVVLCLGRVLEPEEAMSGFANTALVTVGLLFVLSEGLIRTGAVNWLAARLIGLAGQNEARLFAVTMLAVASLSAFINNTPVVVLFVPILLAVCEKRHLAPSKVLMPVCFATTLGGTITLIGTSTNLAVNAWLEKNGGEIGLSRFEMFDFTAFGAIYCAAGLLYLFFIGRRLLPDRQTVATSLGTGRHKEYLTEIRIPAGSRFTGRPVDEALKGRQGLRLLQLIRGEEIHWPPFGDRALAEGDLLLVKGDVSGVLDLQRAPGIETPPERVTPDFQARAKTFTLAELVVTPNSRLVGRTLEEAEFHRETGCHVLALQRHGAHLREKITGLVLSVGDLLLVQGEPETIRKLRGSAYYLLLEGVEEHAINKRQAPVAAGVFFLVVALASVRLHASLDIVVLAMAGTVVLLATRTVSMRQAYQSVHWPILVLIAGMIALSQGMRKTGVETQIAGLVAQVFGPYGPHWVLLGVILATSVLTELINNTAAALLMVPLAARIAAELGANPVGFVVGVVFGASACFATPFGYQTNAFIYGPGGYRFVDFLRVGVPLDVLLVVLSTLLIPVFWPL